MVDLLKIKNILIIIFLIIIFKFTLNIRKKITKLGQSILKTNIIVVTMRFKGCHGTA